MDSSAKYLNLPFKDAKEAFRLKVNLPTERADELERAMQARAFVIAGVTKADLLSDLRAAVDKNIAEGRTREQFKKDFMTIVQRHGWKYKGKPGWRSNIIISTNTAMAYSAGHYKAQYSAAVKKARPYLRYMPSSSKHKRKEHERFYNLVLHKDDPFWKTHRPPNGWGCHCGVRSMSARDVEKLKKKDLDYPVSEKSPKLKEVKHLNKTTGEIKTVLEGCDPGFDYSPGEAAWGEYLSKEEYSKWQAMGKDRFEMLTPGDWAAYGLAEEITPTPTEITPGNRLTDVTEVKPMIERIIGGKEKIYSFEADGFRYDLLVNAEIFARHVDESRLNRTPFLPFIPEAASNPDEVWLSFSRHKGTGKIRLNMSVIKVVQLEKNKAVHVVFKAVNGVMTAWTMIPATVRKKKDINRLRQGRPVYVR